MSGIYTGVQKRIQDLAPHAHFVHYASDNLNLVLKDAVEGNHEIQQFFDTVQTQEIRQITTEMAGQIFKVSFVDQNQNYENDACSIETAGPSGSVSKNTIWTREAIICLLEVYKERLSEILSTTIRNEAAFKHISEDMGKFGFEFTGTQCRDKFKYLKMKYLKNKIT
ncbi:unnamed protein product [Brassicogethes aeneus]|uniref:Myb/SANT-like DNA-binding domain-containing protein n=1 Tax=Brassicogethes aeneus TaxID=1431903 RepID=A0A9P0BIZ3_BRAAE|nr:unnamed protein product [Brassicogethes aeneus]